MSRFLSATVLIAAAQVACEVANLDLRGRDDPIDMPPPELTACEVNGHACIPFEQTQGNELCLDDSQPFADECDRYNSPFGKALCCSKVELSFCEILGNRCRDGDFGVCPFGFEMRAELTCDAPGRPVGKICCEPNPCVMAQFECIVDPVSPDTCPEGWTMQPLTCPTVRESPVQPTCCSLRM